MTMLRTTVILLSFVAMIVFALWLGREKTPASQSERVDTNANRQVSSSESKSIDVSSTTIETREPHRTIAKDSARKTSVVQSPQRQLTNPSTPDPISLQKKMVSKREPRSSTIGFNPLEDYGKGHPNKDLDQIHGAMETYRVLVKNEPRIYPPATTNEIFTRELTGYNLEGLIIIDPDSEFISENGELLDRWGTPLDLHFVSSTDIGILSAGADGTFDTNDDAYLSAK